MASKATNGEARVPPADSQHEDDDNSEVIVGPDGQKYRTAKEGLARIYVPMSNAEKERRNGGGGPAVEDVPQQVFYNPIQQFNRDLSVLAIKAYGTQVLERRAEAFARRKANLANKKRKRQDRALAERPSKMEKGADGAAVAAPGAAATEDAETAAEAARDADQTQKGGAQEATSAAEASGQAAGEVPAAGAAEATPAESQPEAGSTTAPPPPPPPPPPTLPKIRILDALSATGLRALRYAHELPFGVAVTANDLLSAATDSIRRNVELNGLQDKIAVTTANAIGHMYGVVAGSMAAEADAINHGRALSGPPPADTKYDVIDLDPYGTAASFFDAALQAVRHDGGLLCVTCTDAGVWASVGYPEKCFALYGGIPMKGPHSHEAGLRLVLHALATSAAKYGLAIQPQLSLSIDFYCRVFVTVTRSPAAVKFQAGKTMTVYNCDQGCGAWTAQPVLRNNRTPQKRGPGHFYKYTTALGPTAPGPLCPHCGYKTHVAGPMYAGPLHSAAFIQRILDDLPSVSTDVYGTTDRIRGMLSTALEELVAVEVEVETGGETMTPSPTTKEDRLAATDPVPFFFQPTVLAKAMHCNTPHEDALRGALLHLGYHVTRSHCRPGSIKTDAPWAVIWAVMREWVRQKAPVKEENIKPGTTAYRLLRLGARDETKTSGSEDTKSEEPKPSGSKDTKSEEPTMEVVFDEKLGRQSARRGERLVRYQTNPRENWGPMNRAKGH